MPTILLVEDNEMNRDMLSRRLIKRGFDVIMALDGEEGIKLSESVSPDIILMDMSLPIKDGWEATRIIKSNTTMQHIPIIGLSAHAMKNDVDKAIEAGCDDYDTKPIDLNRLLDKIRRLLEK